MNRTEEPQGCLLAILNLFRPTPADRSVTVELPYKRKDYLLSRAERSFFGVLQNTVGDQYLIFAKVRLADLIYIPRGIEQRQSYFNRIQSKHIDFVLCDRDAVRPLLAIELDDSSHRGADRQSRDTFVDSALKAAALPILHVAARSGYNVQELAHDIQQQL